MRWPEPGQWYAEVAGEPAEAAARLVAEAEAGSPLAGDGPRVLAPDGRTAEVVRAWLRHLAGRGAVRSDRVLTATMLPDRVLEPEEDRPPAGDAVVSEIARAVDHAVRAHPDSFPTLSAFASGAGLPTALARLFGDVRRAGLHSRDPGAVASLERLEPEALGRELLQAMGMFEGALERAGWWDGPARLRAAAAAVDRLGPGPWIVCGFGHVPMALLDLLGAVAGRNPVLWLVPVGGEDPDREGLWPDRRSLAWAGAARWRGWTPPGPEPDAPPPPRCVRLAGPAEVAYTAVNRALEAPGTVLLAAEPRVWLPLLEEACARRGARLVGERGPATVASPTRWISGLVDAWAHDLTAARAADLLEIGARLGLRGWEPGGADRADATLRRLGITRGREAVLEALGRLGRPLDRAFRRLDGARDAAGALRAVSEILADAGVHGSAGRGPSVPAREAADQAGQLRALLEDLAGRLPHAWPEEPAHTPELLAARFREALAASVPARRVGVPPGGATPVVRLEALDAPLGPDVGRVILLGVAEGDLVPRGGSTHLIPDRIRAAGPVATMAHWPWHADGVTARRRRLEALLSGRLGPAVECLEPTRDVRGREHVPWSGLPEAEESAPPLDRSPRLAPPPVPEGAGVRIPDLARRVGLRGGRGLAATTVDTWRACPRRFYFERILRAEDREPVSFDLDARQRGTWLHDLLRDLFVRYPGWWRDEPTPAAVRELFDDLRDRDGESLVAGASRQFLDLQATRYLDAASGAMAEHAEALGGTPGVVPVGFEVSMRSTHEREGGDPVVLRGTLDRLDLVRGADGRAEGFVVLDYKTGAVSGYAVGRRGPERKVQLLLYAWMAERTLGLPCLATLAVPVLSGGSPRGVILADPDMPPVPGWEVAGTRTDRVERADFEAAMEEALDAALDVADAVRVGRFPAEPTSPRLCQRCPHSLYCPRERT
ncbi:MAG: PD-(D/E)XK nuclease family protein [Myxococcota bacterium]